MRAERDEEVQARQQPVAGLHQRQVAALELQARLGNLRAPAQGQGDVVLDGGGVVGGEHRHVGDRDLAAQRGSPRRVDQAQQLEPPGVARAPGVDQRLAAQRDFGLGGRLLDLRHPARRRCVRAPPRTGSRRCSSERSTMATRRMASR